MFRNIWECLGMFRNIWECLGMFRNIWEYLGMFGNVWEYLGMFGNVWECLAMQCKSLFWICSLERPDDGSAVLKHVALNAILKNKGYCL